MMLTLGSLANSTPYLGGILLVIVLAWLGAASSLDKQFSSLAKEDHMKEKAGKEKLEPTVEQAKSASGLVEQANSITEKFLRSKGGLMSDRTGAESPPSNSSPVQ